MGRIELPTSPLPRECSATELHGQRTTKHFYNNTTATPGAGEGNRTLVLSLEGFSSTIKLHPLHRILRRTLFRCDSRPRSLSLLAKPETKSFWWRGKDSNLRRQSRQIYSLFPLTAWVPLQTERDIMVTEEKLVKYFSRLFQTLAHQPGAAGSPRKDGGRLNCRPNPKRSDHRWTSLH